ncbi:hypothetical protein PanWU01x14_365070 [Parasponia andersonii]|uniref:Uncharacterized protein n=1 Tax=Parasponia andersonii TaxID=3476 RepID=A0A2P5A663_PARAD|nr:hypothetical protein PanWU01x14_365070 [Parasponia andersonii]
MGDSRQLQAQQDPPPQPRQPDYGLRNLAFGGTRETSHNEVRCSIASSQSDSMITAAHSEDPASLSANMIAFISATKELIHSHLSVVAAIMFPRFVSSDPQLQKQSMV